MYITQDCIFLYVSLNSPPNSHASPITLPFWWHLQAFLTLHFSHSTLFLCNTHTNLLFEPMTKNSHKTNAVTLQETSTWDTVLDLTPGEVKSLPKRFDGICVPKPIAKALLHWLPHLEREDPGNGKTTKVSCVYLFELKRMENWFPFLDKYCYFSAMPVQEENIAFNGLIFGERSTDKQLLCNSTPISEASLTVVLELSFVIIVFIVCP